MSTHLLQANALFLHIPKTGGTWVEEALKACGIATAYAEARDTVSWRHGLPGHLTRRYRFAFTFVRHPLSWYESWWKFQARVWKRFEPGVWHPQRVLERCASDDFSTFVRLCLAHEPAYVSRLYEWYIGPPGLEGVDVIGRYENLANDLVRILRLLGYDFDEDTLRGQAPANVSRKYAGEPVWDPGLRQRVLEREAPAIRRFYRSQRVNTLADPAPLKRAA
jgi:hypothetical protein